MSHPDPNLPDVVLLAAPPVGAAAWSEVQRRLHHHGIQTRAPDLFDPDHADTIINAGSEGLVDMLADDVAGTCLVAHGQAVPLALHLAHRVSIRLLVLSNGPIGSLDPFAAAVSRIARFAGPALRTWSRPTLANTSLASSACLRRLVVNPYVMERETVNQLTQSWTADRLRRRAAVRWMRDLPRLVADAPSPMVPTLLVWGDEDVLYPSYQADQATGLGPDIVQVRVPGGRHLHIVERPWELADQVHRHLRSD